MELDADQVTRRTEAAESLADQLGALRLGAPVEPLGSALPGSRSGPAATALGEVWAHRVRHLATDVEHHAAVLRRSTTALHHVDADLQRRLHGEGR